VSRTFFYPKDPDEMWDDSLSGKQPSGEEEESGLTRLVLYHD
jgi:hypothetical protein